MGKGNTTYQVTPGTAGYIETLRAFEKTKNEFLQALFIQWGEEQGQDIFDKCLPTFDKVSAMICKFLTDSMAENFGDLSNPSNVI